MIVVFLGLTKLASRKAKHLTVFVAQFGCFFEGGHDADTLGFDSLIFSYDTSTNSEWDSITGAKHLSS